jgi:hypothetical protein
MTPTENLIAAIGPHPVHQNSPWKTCLRKGLFSAGSRQITATAAGSGRPSLMQPMQIYRPLRE